MRESGYSGNYLLGLWCSCAFLIAAIAHPQDALADSRELYSVELERHSAGRLFLAPTEASARGEAGALYAVTGNILSKSSPRSAHLVLEVTSDTEAVVHSLDVTKEIEEGATAFGVEWPLVGVADGDYRVRIRVMDPALGEEARLDQHVTLRSRATVTQEVERAREMISTLREAYPTLPPSADQQLRLAAESLAPYPSAARPLIEADKNAQFARRVVGSVRARLALRSMSEALTSETTSAGGEFAGVMGGGIVPGSTVSAGRFADLGFTFMPLVFRPTDLGTPNTDAASDMPRMVWFDGSGGNVQSPSLEMLAHAAGLGRVVGVSLWTTPKLLMQGEEVQRDFQAYVKGIYSDRHALNLAWKEHYFDFNEVMLIPFNESRAYQFDAQSFQRARTTNWLTEQLRTVAPIVAPAEPTLTFTDAILQPAESRLGLDVETLAPLMPMVPVHMAGPLGDARYAQRFPAAQMVWALMHSFAPDRLLIARHSLDYTLDDRLRLDSAAQVRVLAIEAALENVAALALEFPKLGDPVSQAPEALTGFAQALRELDGAADAVDALRDAQAPLVIVWSDSSKVLNDGAMHLNAFARAYEGCVQAGYKVGIVTERQLAEGRWHGVKVVVLPEVTALGREAFAGLEALINGGAVVVRTEFGPKYDEHGNALGDTLPVDANTMLVRGNGPVYEYISALDALHARGVLPDIPRPITREGYPIEGVKSRYVESAAGRFLYLLNLRKEPVSCRFSLPVEGATDLFTGRTVDFPRQIDPLSPMLLRLADATATD